MSEKFIVRVLRHRVTENPTGGTDGKPKLLQNDVDQIYEQEFSKFDIAEFATNLNRKDGQQKDKESLKT